MKRTQVTDLLANIKATFVSFFSILMFVMLGVGVFLGISWAGPALQNAADGMFGEGTFHSFQIQYPYGLTDDNLEELFEAECVSETEAERQSFQTIYRDDHKYTVKVQSLGQGIDTPILVEGTLPTKNNEMAFHVVSAERLGIGVGDTVTFEKDAEEDGSAKSADDDENTSGMQYLLRDSFKVTALVNSADYIAEASDTYGFSPSPSGLVDGLAWVSDNAFDAAAFQNGYPVVNVRCDGLAGLPTFSDEYKQASGEMKETLETLGDTLATARYDDLHGRAQKEIDEAQAKIDDANAKIDDAQAQIDRGEKDIADGEKKLADGRAELEQKRADGQAELDSAYAELMDAEDEKEAAAIDLANARAEIDNAQANIDEADAAIDMANTECDDALDYKAECDAELAAGEISLKQYNSRLDARGAESNELIQPIAADFGIDVDPIDHENYEAAYVGMKIALADVDSLPVEYDGETMTLGEARSRLEVGKAELADAQAEFDSKSAELAAGWDEYYAGQATFESEVAQAEQDIADGEAQLEDAKKQVEDAKKQVKDGKKKVAESEPQLEDAKQKLAAMAKYDWSVMPRSYNAGAGEISTFSAVTDNLSISMAALFIIVGLLVSYFAVSRMVNEQITQIGTKKALGFRRREITISYLLYSGIAVVLGSILGAVIAYFIVEGIIGGVLGGMFAFGMYPAYFGWGLFLIISIVELVLVLGATYLACRKILKKHAVDLLRGPEPPKAKRHFYEKWGIWEKLPLFIQTIVNNCVNDKRRVLSTLVGVAGCTALIVTAITLNNDVMKSYDLHYENVYGFNDIAYADPDVEGAIGNLESAIQDGGATATAQAFAKRYLLEQPNGDSGVVNIIVPTDEEAFNQVYHVNPITDGEFDLSADGAWVTQAYADHFGAKVGDVIVVDGGDGTKHEIPILGFYEFWLTYHEMVMGKGYFEKEFGDVSPNAVLAQTGDVPLDDIEAAASSVEGYDSIVDDATKQYGNFETFSTVSSAVVLIYLVLATLMAIIVLLNLNVMFIEEKKRELIVLMINGFSVKDARHYISYDNIVLTALGIIVGLLLGCLMGSITVSSIEPITGVFVKSVDAWAVIIGIAGSALLAIIMGLIALRRVNKFDLTDINRF